METKTTDQIMPKVSLMEKEKEPTLPEQIKILNEHHVNTERNLLFLLDKLKNAGEDCDCKHEETIDTIHYGSWREIHRLCLSCGGNVEVKE